MTVSIYGYHDGVRYLEGGRDKNSRPIANNTRVERRGDDTIAIRLHQTDVVTFYEDGRTMLNSGGWRTMTTKARMNDHLGHMSVYADKGRWFVGTGFYGSGTVLSEFYDGITFDDRMRLVTKPITPEETKARLKEQQTVYSSIQRFITKYVAALREGLDEEYGDGSCWDCAHPEVEGRTTEGGDRAAHVRRHIENNEHPIAMAMTAMREKGYREEGIGYYLGSYGDRNPQWLGGERVRIDKYHPIFRALRDYLKKRLLPDVTGSTPPRMKQRGPMGDRNYAATR